MDILFVSHKHPPAIGGMEKQSYELINGMRKHARVFTLVYEGKGSRLAFFLSLQSRIIRLCRQHPEISIIHFNDGLMAAACCWHQGYKHLQRTVTLHGLDVVFPSRLYKRFLFPRLNKFQLVFAVSQATRTACIKQGLLPEKIVVINNGVDQSISRPGKAPASVKRIAGMDLSNKKLLVAMGRPVKRKGFSWFIENVVPFLNEDTVLVFIGPFRKKPPLSELLLNFLPRSVQHKAELFLGYPSDERCIRNLLDQPELASRIKHLGRLSFEEIVEVLSAADAFVVPNIPVAGDMEGFGLVCLEACLCGTTVFASAIDGIPDAIQDGKNGFLLPAADKVAWAVALNNHLAAPPVTRLSPEVTRNYTVEKFSWEKMVEAYQKQFSLLMRLPD